MVHMQISGPEGVSEVLTCLLGRCLVDVNGIYQKTFALLLWFCLR